MAMNTHFDILGFLYVIFIILTVVFILVLFTYVYEMTKTRGRSIFYWIAFSVVFTPILGMILLACLGETEEKRRERLLKDNDYLRMMQED